MLPRYSDEPTKPFVIMLKSYGMDVEYSKRFLASYQEHNKDGIPLVVIVPEADIPDFRFFERAGAMLLSENLFEPYLATERIHGNHPNYVNHQIIRLSFWELGIAENYLNVDSENVFARDFFRSDFMASADVPYTFLSEDFELQVDHDYYHETWSRRLLQFDAMKEAMGWNEWRNATVHGMAVYSAKVWRSLKEDFRDPAGLSYQDILRISPIPPTWYSFWAQKSGVIPVVRKEPWFKFYHNAGQHFDHVVRDVTYEDLARGYVAVNLNTGFSRKYGVLDVGDPKAKILGSYLPLGVLRRALQERIRLDVKSRRSKVR